MSECRWIRTVEQWFDGACADAQRVSEHLAACPECAAYARRLRVLRDGAAAVAKQEEVRDPQFAAFMAGIREQIQVPRRRHRGAWALVSLTAAALIVAAATFLVLSNGPRTADATVVESCSTEIQGATVTSYATENGVTTVWVKVPIAQDDIL